MRHANQLQFNLDVPTDFENMRTGFTSPSAIVFERIIPGKSATQRQHVQRRNGSPVRLSVLSSAKLSKALQLAKRDLKLAKRKKALQSFAKENELNAQEIEVMTPQNEFVMKSHLPMKKNQSVQKSSHNSKKSPQKSSHKTVPKLPKQDQEILDIKRLRLEMRQHIFGLDQNLSDNGMIHRQKLLSLNQEEEQRLVVRHLEQMRKFSRTVYTLQQQVQVIKGELGRSRSASHEKDRTLSKLAAVHRGTVRMMQLYSTQFPEHLIFDDNFVAVSALYQEVSRLIKELSICSLQLGLATIEEVEKISDVLKSIEPKYTSKPLPSPKQARHQKSSPRSFKSNQVTLVKKSFVHPKYKQNSIARSPNRSRRMLNESKSQPVNADVLQHQQTTDIFDRPEWLPPSNSPRKSVGPPPLSPLLNSPAPSHRYKPHALKQVKFCSTPNERNLTEHDVDIDNSHASSHNLKALKSQLAEELETELRNRINPLLQKVEEMAKSATASKVKQRNPEEEILENQVRDIIDETRKEMKDFQKQQQVEKDAVNLYQGPSIETLMQRLDTIGKEEEAIRRRWQEINYHSMRPVDPLSSETSRNSAPSSPQPINFTKNGSEINKQQPEKKIVNFLPKVTTKHEPAVRKFQRDLQKDQRPFTGQTLVLPQSTVNAITRNKKEYERHLKFTFHEPKGNFDPWRLVEEISDNVLQEVITSVTQEVNGMCEDYANDIFQREFAGAPLSAESSLLSSDTSSLLSQTTPKRP